MYPTVIIAPVVTALLALIPVPTAAVAAVTTPGPAQQFAAAIADRASLGWRLRYIDVGYREDTVRVSTLMAGTDSARWFNLVFESDGSSARAFSSFAASVPAEQRVYRGEHDIVAAMSAAAPIAIHDECGMLFVDNGKGGVSIDEFDYYVVTDRIEGDRAPAGLSDALAAALESGYELIAVEQIDRGPGGAVSGVNIVLDGDERMAFAVGLDAQGRVVAVETQVSPSTYTWQSYARPDALAKALRGATIVERISMNPSTSIPDEATLVLGGGRRDLIEIGDFVPGDLECPC